MQFKMETRRMVQYLICILFKNVFVVNILKTAKLKIVFKNASITVHLLTNLLNMMLV